ncbi:hypothetical protein CH380_07850 [Leptospira adleri]|uniref:Uncharacterized protein n=2 Tax=Leptospira adleri TaxID=2023186 RepID=A0A2M9YQU0_9LEPT|nr:hypothetical protein CH380_07850 [Leptospira adleri]PJZ59526.1 hypothetical protein CH376_23225 [Leptospira adleri]
METAALNRRVSTDSIFFRSFKVRLQRYAPFPQFHWNPIDGIEAPISKKEILDRYHVQRNPL